MFSIHSTISNRELVFSQFDREWEAVSVEIRSFDVSAKTGTYLYTDVMGLNKFFQELGSQEKSWKDLKSWASIEDDFSISATCSSLGRITFQIKLSSSTGASEDWHIVVGLETEFGQLKQIAKDSMKFFCSEAQTE